MGSRAQDTETDVVWYEGGLRFSCTKCRDCCAGEPGYVWVKRDEIERMAASVGLPLKEFAAQHCRKVWWRISLREHPNGDCTFLTPDGCAVYAVRPAQCRTFPFWPDNLRSRQSWDYVGARCPGMGRGKLYSRDEIDVIIDDSTST